MVSFHTCEDIALFLHLQYKSRMIEMLDKKY